MEYIIWDYERGIRSGGIFEGGDEDSHWVRVGYSWKKPSQNDIRWVTGSERGAGDVRVPDTDDDREYEDDAGRSVERDVPFAEWVEEQKALITRLVNLKAEGDERDARRWQESADALGPATRDFLSRWLRLKSGMDENGPPNPLYMLRWQRTAWEIADSRLYYAAMAEHFVSHDDHEARFLITSNLRYETPVPTLGDWVQAWHSLESSRTARREETLPEDDDVTLPHPYNLR